MLAEPSRSKALLASCRSEAEATQSPACLSQGRRQNTPAVLGGKDQIPSRGTERRYGGEQNELHFSTQTQGFLQLIAGISGIAAAASYGILCRRVNLRTLLVWCMLVATIAKLGYLFYSSLRYAQAIEGLNGFGYTLAELALMDLAVRSTPAGSEGLGFSIMISVRNLAVFGTDWFGSNLLDQYHLSFSSLVIANSATTLIAVPLVFLLSRPIVARKDGEIS